MKKLVLLFILALTTPLVFAQNLNQDSVQTKKDKREARLERQFQLTKNLLQDKSFVLESDFLQNRYGDRYLVSPMINFVKVEPNNEAVIQIGSSNGFGPNGVGGVTAKGKITGWKLTENQKNKSFYVMMNVLTQIGRYDVSFSVMSNGQATARLTGMSRGSLTFDGNLVPVDNSIVYEGQSIGG